MPTIPIIQNQLTPTADSTGTVSNSQIPLSNELGKASTAIADYYIAQKKQEAAVKTLDYKNQYWNDSEDGTKGLFSIKSKWENIPDPTAAKAGVLEDTNNYLSYLENKLSGESDYLKKSVLSEFKADLNRVNLSVMQGAANALDKKESMIADQATSIELGNLDGHPELLPTSKTKIEANLSNLFINDPIKREQALRTSKGILDEFVASQLVQNTPSQARVDLANPNLFQDLAPEKKIQLLKQAEEGSYKVRSNQILEATVPSTITDEGELIKAEATVRNGTFNGNKQLQNIYNSFSEAEKVRFTNDLNTRVRDVRNDVLLNRAANLNSVKDKAIQDVSKTVNDVLDKRTTNQQIDSDKNLSPEVKDQYKILNDKLANNTFSDQSNADLNLKIAEMLFKGEIKSPTDKFKVGSETEARSIIERAGDGLNKQDVLRYQDLFTKGADTGYIDKQREFYKFINKNINSVKGNSNISSLDPGSNERANRFISDMYSKYQDGLKNGKSSSELLNQSSFFGSQNKDYIGSNIQGYIPSQSDVLKSINDAVLKAKTTPNTNPPPARLPNEKPNDYLNSDRYLNWLKSQGK